MLQYLSIKANKDAYLGKYVQKDLNPVCPKPVSVRLNR